MTSEVNTLKTNDFQRRRKLRLQQVREQSKDIAKKIRERANIEKLRQVVELDTKKQQEYFQKQERLVKRLEEYYARGIKNLGTGHKNANELNSQDEPDKVDLSKQRGKEAAAELRKKRQEVLDKQKKILDRKLQAREAANELSREKSVNIINKLQSKTSSTAVDEFQNGKEPDHANNDNLADDNVKHDMATQWEVDEIPHEWEPNIPILSLPKDDNNSVKEFNNNESKSDKSKRNDLFACSEEMPSSLRGGLNNEERIPSHSRPSLTLVSEYLQNRDLRLRETDSVNSKKKSEELQSLRNTIMRARVTREGKGNEDKTSKLSEPVTSAAQKKPSVTMYNHSTRDSRNLPYTDNKNVVRNTISEEDAYSQAVKETISDNKTEKDHKKLQEMRSKVAVTKQNVEKEYRATISFLNSLPKDPSNKPIRNAFMDENRKQMQKDAHQRKMQHEFKTIMKQCSKHSSRSKGPRKPKSPIRFENDFQYSWMPVPESDGNLAIHTIPNSVKEGGNSAMFKEVDSYHEYRSRHKHTPPTKDTAQQKQSSSDTETENSETSVYIEKLSDNKSKLSMADAEGIVIYKILDCNKKDKKSQKKLMKEIAKSLTGLERSNKETVSKESVLKNSEVENRVTFEQVDEGVYKAVNQSGGLSYNIMSCYKTNIELWRGTTKSKPWWDNISSMYFCGRDGETEPDEDKTKSLRVCVCGRRLNNDRYPRPGTPSTQSDGGDSKSSRTTNSCVVHKKCACENSRPPTHSKTQSPIQQSKQTSASTSSFKTATTDRAVNPLPSGGFIKLIDDGGAETGKFYIGTSGFLKDDAYEVVIHLKKKGDDKPEKTLIVENLSQQPIEKASSTSESIEKEVAPTEKQDVAVQNKTETEAQTLDQDNTKKSSEKQDIGIQNDANSEAPNTLDKEISKPSIEAKDSVTDTVLTQLIHKFLSEHYENLVPTSTHETATVKTVAEKGVSTSFQETMVLRSDVAQPAAASTCTQTSMSSPLHRPPLFHMSSSTSTAYMSPPDMILPQFFKGKSAADINDPISYENDITLPHNSDCRCGKCVMHLAKDNMINLNKLRNAAADDLRAPPNTGRNCKKVHTEDANYNKDKIKDANTKLHTRRKHKCRKSETVKRRCSKRPSLTNKYFPSSSSRDKCYSKFSKSNLNPIVRDYIHKLLTLNRESLKAVEVMDEECSSVATPGSSIINIKNNKDNTETEEPRVSLEQIKNLLKQHLLKDYMSEFNQDFSRYFYSDNIGVKKNKQAKCNKSLGKRPYHKVKSLNISKHLFKQKYSHIQPQLDEKTTSSSSQRQSVKNSTPSLTKTQKKVRSSSSPTPRSKEHIERKKTDKEGTKQFETDAFRTGINDKFINESKREISRKASSDSNSRHPTATSESESSVPRLGSDKHDSLSNISTQTSNMGSDLNFVKLAESKIQNMEKIADLTEKCTKRLSNLAKVLEEVRKNKSLAYSQMSSLENSSDSDKKSDKNFNKVRSSDPCSNALKPAVPDTPEPNHNDEKTKESGNTFNSTNYGHFLRDIPKLSAISTNNLSDTSLSSSKKPDSTRLNTESIENNAKHRPKPPPALSRLHLKNGQDLIIPHELSTVVEVDSPMSLKAKSQMSRNDTKAEIWDYNSIEKINSKLIEQNKSDNDAENKSKDNPDLLDTKGDVTNNQTKVADSCDDSKMQMLELNQFNEIMLKPFFSIQEYAKRYNIETLDDGSNLDDIPKEAVNEEMSSVHSDGSLPDVISELLKRNLITEPFKFDSGSNVNSTTISSESTFSVLALSKATKEKNKSSVMFKNKDNVAETSDTLSLSSNPDLENAFKKLGMGWASSTLKKTKERLALSSSSNTSSSSLSQFKIKTYNQEIPALVNDTISSTINSSKPIQKRKAIDSPKNVEQQTLLTNTMTVKEFLTRELAKKITFNKSKNETEEEFVSLFETQMPDEMKNTSKRQKDETSIDNSASMRSGNRARTSTPVQLFKSMTYNSTSSSNLSNGLFSNADDLSSVKITSNSMKHSTSDKDDLTIPNLSLKKKKGSSECSKSE